MVVGRSDIVGKPVAMLLLHEHCTVTICHSKTPDLAAVCREGDILVAAIGRPAMITGDYIKPGAAVIDVGTNRVDNPAEAARIFRNSAEKLAALEKRGYLLVGDVDPIDVAAKAAAYSPVPGGVGPLTISMLMVNTVASAERHSSSMLKVGLTGGLACGKSFVGQALAGFGCYLIQADELGHQVLAPDGEAYHEVVTEFGREILNAAGEIDRPALAARVFGNPERLARLNAAVHPAVIRREEANDGRICRA